ncbi:MAG: hypothetical protein EOP37_23715 [Rubrivivax sp.]|nr:MAG: hypothetical protein EOP37_23715 [Rubrivivax sp.]
MTAEDLRAAIASGFARFGIPPPRFSQKRYGLGGEVPYVQGNAQDEWCWVRVFEWPTDLTDHHGARFACSVESRGQDTFAALVVFSVLEHFGDVVFDDACYVSSGEELTREEFEILLSVKVEQSSDKGSFNVGPGFRKSR